MKTILKLVLVGGILTTLTACTQSANPGTTPVAPTRGAAAVVPATTQSAAVPTFAAAEAARFYNLPPAKLGTATGLYASPYLPALIVPVTIPAGETVYVMGRNNTRSHLRVVWNTGVGWIPVSYTEYNGKRERLDPLPVFTREPPACTEYITTQFALGSTWTSSKRQRIAIVADLFRTRFGNFPPTTLSLLVNGKEVESTRRRIAEQGQFSLKDVVFTLPSGMQEKDTLGYRLDPPVNEPLTFMATLFGVPEGCKWKLD